MRRVHRDRAVYLGDPDFVDVPVARLINQYYAAGQRASIRMDAPRRAPSLPGVDAPSPGPSTTHFSVIDAQRQHGRGDHHAQFLLRLGPHGAGHRHPAEQPDGRLLGEARRAERLSAHRRRCQRHRAEEAAAVFVDAHVRRGAERPDDHRLARRQLHSRHGASSARSISWTARARRRSSRAPRFHHQFSPDVLQFETGCVDARGAQGARGARPHVARRHAHAGATCRSSPGTTRPEKSKPLRIRAARAWDWSTDATRPASRALRVGARFFFFGVFARLLLRGFLLHELDARRRGRRG